MYWMKRMKPILVCNILFNNIDIGAAMSRVVSGVCDCEVGGVTTIQIQISNRVPSPHTNFVKHGWTVSPTASAKPTAAISYIFYILHNAEQ